MLKFKEDDWSCRKEECKGVAAKDYILNEDNESFTGYSRFSSCGTCGDSIKNQFPSDFGMIEKSVSIADAFTLCNFTKQDFYAIEDKGICISYDNSGNACPKLYRVRPYSPSEEQLIVPKHLSYHFTRKHKGKEEC